MATRKSAKPKKPTTAGKAKVSRAPTESAKPNVKGSDGLTDQQRAFVAEYLKDNNATKAALRAGYKPETARQQGSRLLTNVVIRGLVDSHQQETLQKVQRDTGITLERTLREVARIAYFDPRRMFDAKGNPLPINELDDDTAAVIAGLDVLEEYDGSGADRVLVGHVKKWKLADKKGALDMLMKHLGGYKADNKQAGEAAADALAQLLAGMRSSIPVVANPVDNEED